MGILCGILTVPHNIVMYLNNVMVGEALNLHILGFKLLSTTFVVNSSRSNIARARHAY